MSITRSERLLQKLVGDKVLSQAGKDWLVVAIDPFHDNQLKDLQGWPDLETSASVVRCVKQTMSVSATSGGGGAPAGPWDCHVSMLPWTSPMPFYTSNNRLGNVIQYNSTVTSAPIGGVIAVAGAGFATGAAAAYPPIGNSAFLGALTVDTTLTSGMHRIIGCGMEIVDTTANLYQQGQCVVYRQSQFPKDASAFLFSDVTAGQLGLSVADCTEVRLPPTTSKDAMLFPGSRQWAAKEGAYIVGTFHSNENPPYNVDYNNPLLHPANFDEQVGVMPTQTVWFPTPAGTGITAPSAAFPLFTAQPIHLNPLHQSGAIFMGLNPQSSLAITYNVFIESFPSLADTKTLVLATPSAEFDPVALNIYSHAIGLMPVGVMVRENGFGDWFREVVQQVGNIASYIPHPIAQGVATAAKGGVKLIDAFSQPPSPMVHKKAVLPSHQSAESPLVKKKKKKLQKKNATLANGSRGKKGNVQGPMRH